MGNGNPGQPGSPPVAGPPGQYNTATSGGSVYAAQGGNQYINIGTGPGKRGLRIGTKVLLVTLLVDVVFFFYGMLAYTGENTSGDSWRAGIFLFMFLLTSGMIGRWIRRRA
jgi:DMSO reductase anchor subunit